MKKFLALALALMMVLSLAACGGKAAPAPSGSGVTGPDTSQQEPSNTPANNSSAIPDSESEPTTELPEPSMQNLTSDNWQEIIKAYTKIDIQLPDGWTFSSAEATAISRELIFACPDEESFDNFAESIFEGSKSVAYKGPYAMMGEAPFSVYTDALFGDTDIEKFYHWVYELSDDIMDTRIIRISLKKDVCTLFIA